jgi:chromosome condensin MukBEF ATPase and DNA-binding subunit MukB
MGGNQIKEDMVNKLHHDFEEL